jgi:hypothetical protein
MAKTKEIASSRFAIRLAAVCLPHGRIRLNDTILRFQVRQPGRKTLFRQIHSFSKAKQTLSPRKNSSIRPFSQMAFVAWSRLTAGYPDPGTAFSQSIEPTKRLAGQAGPR